MNTNYGFSYYIPYSDHEQQIPMFPYARQYPNQPIQQTEYPDPFANIMDDQIPGVQNDGHKGHPKNDFPGIDDSPIHRGAVASGLYKFEQNPSFSSVFLRVDIKFPHRMKIMIFQTMMFQLFISLFNYKMLLRQHLDQLL